MDRIKEGIITVDGIELGPNTTLEDLEKIEMDKGVQRDHPQGFFELVFNHPIHSDGVDFRVSVRYKKKTGQMGILLDPENSPGINGGLKESREDQEISESWLKRNMGVEPTIDTDDGIFYDFPWGHVRSIAAGHVNFGYLKGGILIFYGDDM